MIRHVPAIAAVAFLVVALLAGAGPVLGLAFEHSGLVSDAYIWRVTWFTILQAGLSTALSLALGVPLGLALTRQSFWGRKAFISLLAIPNGLPAIVGVLGIVAIFGAQGRLGGVIPVYGLTGILLAHVFFNFPLIARTTFAALEAVPPETHRLAAQLGFTPRDVWKQIDRPAIAAALPGIAVLVFLLCAASFTIVLTLGGGPRATTLDVAIYQALRFDFDPARAALLATIQALICSLLVVLSLRFPAHLVSMPALRAKTVRSDEGHNRARDTMIILLSLTLLGPPLFEIVLGGLRGLNFDKLLVEAMITSLLLGSATALLSVGLAWPLCHWAARRSRWRGPMQVLALSGLILPPAVLATGWFLLANELNAPVSLAPVLVLALNAMMALPFTYAILAPAVARAAAEYDCLCASLAIRGMSRLRLVEIPVLRKPLGLAMAMAAIVSLGDLTAITLFGSGTFATLPALLYQQMGSYRMEGAGSTALVLLLVTGALMALMARWGDKND